MTPQHPISLKAWFLPIVPLLLWAALQPFMADVDLFYALNRAANRWSDGTLAFFVFLGNGWGVLSITFPLILFAPRALVAAAAAGLSAGLMARIIKNMLDIPRPAAVLDRDSFRIVGDILEALSMPSGHTLTVFAIATTFYFSLPATHRVYGLWLFVLAAISGTTRVAVGAHWPSDVFAGAAIGLLFGLIMVTLFRRLPDTLFQPQSWLMRLVAAMGLVCIYILATGNLESVLIQPLQMLGIVVIAACLCHFLPTSLQRR